MAALQFGHLLRRPRDFGEVIAIWSAAIACRICRMAPPVTMPMRATVSAAESLSAPSVPCVEAVMGV
jgi:hypothetical protein